MGLEDSTAVSQVGPVSVASSGQCCSTMLSAGRRARSTLLQWVVPLLLLATRARLAREPLEDKRSRVDVPIKLWKI